MGRDRGSLTIPFEFKIELAAVEHCFSMFQMTYIRLLECLHVVLQKLQKCMNKIPGDSEILVKKSISCKWLRDLMFYGKSKLSVVVMYWTQIVLSLLDLLMESCDDKTSAILAIEKLIQCGVFLLIYDDVSQEANL
ncbi:hypothetical protein Tco_0387053 [Tanacetum coccineum]